MAAAKRQRKRKLRTTEVISSSSSSSPSSSSSSSSSESSESDSDDSESGHAAKLARRASEGDEEERSAAVGVRRRNQQSVQIQTDRMEEDDFNSVVSSEIAPMQEAGRVSDSDEMDVRGEDIDTEPASREAIDASQKISGFESWYLRLVTEQYANDLDQLRTAPDFKESSVPVLVKALKQGTETFSDANISLIMGGNDS